MDDISRVIELAKTNTILYRCLEDIYIILTSEKTTIPKSDIHIFNEILIELKSLKEKAIKSKS